MSPMDLIAPLVTNLQIIDVPKDPKKTVLIFLVLDKPVEPTTGGKSVDNIVLKASHTPGHKKEPLEHRCGHGVLLFIPLVDTKPVAIQVPLIAMATAGAGQYQHDCGAGRGERGAGGPAAAGHLCHPGEGRRRGRGFCRPG